MRLARCWQDQAMSSLGQCPSCGDRFRPGVQACPACRVALEPVGDGGGSAAPPRVGDGVPTTVGDEAPATLDLDPLSEPERRLVAQLLTARRVRHSWQGGILVVPARLLGEAELAVEQALAAGRPVLDAAAPATVYEVAAWPSAVHAKLARLLEASGIGHEWDANGDLVVAEADEEAVEGLFDQIDESEVAAAPDPLPVLESLHADLIRLAREPLDDRARAGVAGAVEVLGAAAPPFGFEPTVWRSLVSDVSDFADRLDSLDGDVVRDRAADLRDDLRAWL